MKSTWKSDDNVYFALIQAFTRKERSLSSVGFAACIHLIFDLSGDFVFHQPVATNLQQETETHTSAISFAAWAILLRVLLLVFVPLENQTSFLRALTLLYQQKV